MLVLVLSLTMVVALTASIVIAVHEETEKARVKVVARKGRVLR